jgi:simple sugar transport system substrate-binding protein
LAVENDTLEQTPEFGQKDLEVSRRTALRTAAKLGLGSAAMVAALKAGHVEDALAAGRSDALPLKSYHFVFVNHVTTNAFFTPTQSGAADACKLLGCTFQWTGSQNAITAEMVKAMQTAIAGKADGIAVCIVDAHAFDAPTNAAFAAGIPVIAYNADGSPTNKRISYVGQDLFQSGVGMGQRIAALVGSGKVGLFIATPGALNIQPRIDGARSVLAKTAGITLFPDVATGALIAAERTAVEAWWTGHQDVKGMFAVDQGTTQGIVATIQKHGLRAKGVKCGGYDLPPQLVDAVNKGLCDFTIDQQPYLQGFYPVIQLYLYKISGGLVGAENMNTGIKFVTKSSVGQYLKPNVFQGSSTSVYDISG